MKLTPDQKKMWSDLYQFGDYEAISKSTKNKLSAWTIRSAFAEGKASDEVIDAIHKFYITRKRRNDQRLAELNGFSNDHAA